MQPAVGRLLSIAELAALISRKYILTSPRALPRRFSKTSLPFFTSNQLPSTGRWRCRSLHRLPDSPGFKPDPPMSQGSAERMELDVFGHPVQSRPYSSALTGRPSPPNKRARAKARVRPNLRLRPRPRISDLAAGPMQDQLSSCL